MKLGPVTKLDKRDKNDVDDHAMSENCIVTTIFPNYAAFPGAIRKSVKFLLIVALYLTKTEKKELKNL